MGREVRVISNEGVSIPLNHHQNYDLIFMVYKIQGKFKY